MACSHAGPHEVIEMAEEWLRQQGIAGDLWTGRRFGHGENLDEGMWASVAIEIERRGDEWIVTRLDRSSEPLSAGDVGFRPIP